MSTSAVACFDSRCGAVNVRKALPLGGGARRPNCYRRAKFSKRKKMKAFVKTLVRRLPVLGGLVDQQSAAPAESNIGLNPIRSAMVASGRLGATATSTDSDPSSTTHSYIATREDIFYCFRLLLGRIPNSEEWPGHSSRAGEDLENVVSSYITSREFSARGLLNKTYHDRVELVRLPRFSLFASREDLAVGCHVVSGHPYEPGISAVFNRYIKPGMTVVDIGANIGALTMLLASLVGPSGLVVAVEPNPENIRLLEASRRINQFEQVLVIEAAAGRQTGILALNVSYSNGTTGDLPESVTAVLASLPVPCFALDAILPKDRRMNLIKVDVEGAELNALIGLSEMIARDHPLIVSEFSPGALPGISHCTGPEYLSFLIAHGYGIGVIEPDGAESAFGDDIGGVMAAYSRSGIDHIDIIANPK